MATAAWKVTQAPFASPWLMHHRRQGLCYFCDQHCDRPFAYDAYRSYCNVCFAPYYPTSRKGEGFRGKKMQTRWLNPRALWASFTSLMTIGTTAALTRYPFTKPWAISLCMGGGASASLWVAYLSEWKVKVTRPDSVARLYAVVQQNLPFFQDFLINPNQGEDLLRFLRILHDVPSGSLDSVAHNLYPFQPHERHWTHCWSLLDVIEHFEDCDPIFSQALAQFRTLFVSAIELTVTDTEKVEVLLALLSCTQRKVAITLRGEGSLSFQNVYFGTNIASLTLANLTITEFNPSLWNVQDSIVMEKIQGLHSLPEVVHTETDDPGLSLTIRNSSLQHLPYTIAKRKIQRLDLEGCTAITSLPSSLRANNPSKRWTNLTGTQVPEVFRKEFILHGDEPDLWSEETTSPIRPMEIDRRTPLHYLTHFSCMTSFGLLFLWLDKRYVSGDEKGITETLPFWAGYMGMSLASTYMLSRAESMEIPTIEVIQVLLNRCGRESIDGQVYDWDRLWRTTLLDQSVAVFVQGWMDMIENRRNLPFAQHLWRFVYRQGGLPYARSLMRLPFHQMIARLSNDAACCPVLSDALTMVKKSIQRSLHLRLEDWTRVPHPWIMRAYFSLMACGEDVSLTLDWSLQGKPQPLSLSTIPFGCGITSLTIYHAHIVSMPPSMWQMRDQLHFWFCKGGSLPEIPALPYPQPLTFSIRESTFAYLPQQLERRGFHSITIEKTLLRGYPSSLHQLSGTELNLEDGWKNQIMDRAPEPSSGSWKAALVGVGFVGACVLFWQSRQK